MWYILAGHPLLKDRHVNELVDSTTLMKTQAAVSSQ